MRLTVPERNRLVNEMAMRLTGGALVVFSGTRPTTPETALGFQQELARVQVASFALAETAVAVLDPIPETVIAVSGEASWAQWQTSSGEVLADVLVRAVSDPDANDADMLLDRTDFQRGGLLMLSRATLSLPRAT
jgi:hypothetical protein